MTRKDFVLIAAVLNSRYIATAPNSVARDTVDNVAMAMVQALRETNRNFDRDRFLAAVRKEEIGAAYSTMIGEGGTYSIGSDRYPATVIQPVVFKFGPNAGKLKGVVVQEDDSFLVGGSEQDGSAYYRYARNPYAPERTFLLNSRGQLVSRGVTLVLGARRRYHDPHV